MTHIQDPIDAGPAWQIELLCRQFLQLIDPNELAIPGSKALRLPNLQARIYDLMFNEEKLRFSPNGRYKFRVLKKLITAIERAFVDPEEDVCFPYYFLDCLNLSHFKE